MPAFRRSRSLPPADLATLASPPAAPQRYHALRAELRCYLCAETFGALETAVRRVERVDWVHELPRRGRRPRWLIALRAQQDLA